MSGIEVFLITVQLRWTGRIYAWTTADCWKNYSLQWTSRCSLLPWWSEEMLQGLAESWGNATSRLMADRSEWRARCRLHSEVWSQPYRRTVHIAEDKRARRKAETRLLSTVNFPCDICGCDCVSRIGLTALTTSDMTSIVSMTQSNITKVDVLLFLTIKINLLCSLLW